MRTTLRFKNTIISYWETNSPSAPSIYFFSGNTVPASAWHHQLTDPLFSGYRIIVIEVVGFAGTSNRNNYNADEVAAGIASVLKECNNGREFMIVGFKDDCRLLSDTLLHQVYPSAVGLVSPRLTPGTTFPPQGIADKLAGRSSLQYQPSNAPNSCYTNTAAHQYAQNNYTTTFCPQLHSISSNAGVPVFVACGSNDPFYQQSNLADHILHLWTGSVCKIEGAGTMVQTEQPAAFNELLARYAAQQLCV